MDTPTYIILFSILASLVLVLCLKVFPVSRTRAQSVLLSFISVIWISITLGGEFLFGWASNTTCSQYLGCVNGFAGYDAFEHMFFGVVVALALIWLSGRYPQYAIVPSQRWKAVVIIISIVALIGAGR